MTHKEHAELIWNRKIIDPLHFNVWCEHNDIIIRGTNKRLTYSQETILKLRKRLGLIWSNPKRG